MKKILWLAGVLCCALRLAAGEVPQPQFSTAGFYTLPGTGREVASMNLAWRLHKGAAGGQPFAEAYDDSGWAVVNLPDGIERVPLEASGGCNYQGEAWYRKHFTLGREWAGKKLFLHFEGIMGKSRVWLNGQEVAAHFGGYTPVIIDVTGKVRLDGKNTLAVWADNSDDGTYPVGKPQDMLDFTYFGGIYRDCWLVRHNPVHITDANYEDEVAGGGVFVSFGRVDSRLAEVRIKTHVRNEDTRSRRLEVEWTLRRRGGTEAVAGVQRAALRLRSGQAGYAGTLFRVEQPCLWSPEHPDLYYLDIRVKDEAGQVVDGYRQRIGIRSIEFRQEQGLWINGQPYGKIMGTNRHQDFAVLGNAVPNILQWRDAKKLRDAGMKVIRTHYVIDPAFMDACDELGLFALVETPGWQFWNDDPAFGRRVCADIRAMIRLHRNHASLFCWEPVLNETHYPESFAREAERICREEYPYPYSIAACDDQAPGYQYFNLLLRPAKLVPGKTFFVREWGDNVDDWNAHNSDSRAARGWGEVPMLVQAQHYADGYAQVWSQPAQVVGGCFWHSFDHQRGYHPDPFYGGMMDAWRQPKTAYYLFMSQRDTVRRHFGACSGPMVYIAHEMTPFSPADVTVYSNCEEVRLTVFKDGRRYAWTRPAGAPLPSPVITFRDAFSFLECKKLARAGKHGDCYLLAEGLVGGKVVATHKRYPAYRPVRIRLRLDDERTGLVANGSDVVAVVAEVVDARGTVKRLNNSLVRFEVEGEASMVGGEVEGVNPQQVSWGSAVLLLRSTARAGRIRVTARMERPGSQRPATGELVFESLPDPHREVYDPSEWAQLSAGVPTRRTVGASVGNGRTELEKENERLRRELNALRLKEVERQQTEFGVGIND